MGDEALFLSAIKTDEIWARNEDGENERVGETKEVKIYDKIRSLENLGKHLGIFEKDNNQKKVDQASAETLVEIAKKINAAG